MPWKVQYYSPDFEVLPAVDEVALLIADGDFTKIDQVKQMRVGSFYRAHFFKRLERLHVLQANNARDEYYNKLNGN